jgi:hypothetical protein
VPKSHLSLVDDRADSFCPRAKVYVAGPMTGVPQMNFPAFDKAAAHLREQGFQVVSPAELDSPESRAAALASMDGSPTGYAEGETWGGFLARDVKLIADEGIEAIVCLPGWEKSRGARLETFVGRLCGLEILTYPWLEKVTPGYIDIAHASTAVATSRVLDFALEAEESLPPLDFDPLPGEPISPPELLERARRELGVDPPPYSINAGGEIRVVNETTGGEKGQKAQQFNLLPWPELATVAELYAAGAKKYAAHNWAKGYQWSLSFDSLIRHAMAFWGGEELDPETHCPHMASVVFHALALLRFAREFPTLDDRPGQA